MSSVLQTDEKAAVASVLPAPSSARIAAARIDWIVALAAVLAALAVGLYGGVFAPIPLAVMTAGWALAVAAAFMGRHSSVAQDTSRATRVILIVSAVGASLWHVVAPPGLYLKPFFPNEFRIAAGVAGFVAATYALPLPRAIARWRFAVVLACFVYMARVVLTASPAPFIDVWWIQQQGAAGILSGNNPYILTYPNYYGDDTFFAPGTLENGRITFYPYPPLTFLLGAVALLVAGDIRVMLVAMVVVAAIAMWWLGSDDIPELAAILLLMQPRSFLVAEQAWTDPLVLGMLAVVLVAVRRSLRGRRWSTPLAGIAGGLLAVSKQFSPIIAIPLAVALPSRKRWKIAAIAGGVLLAFLAPFAAWNFSELWHDLVQVQFAQPFRADALSWLVPAAMALQRPLPSAFGFAIALAVLLGTLRSGASIAQALRSSAATFLSFVLFNKQAFVNYYWLAVGLLLFSLVAQTDATLANPCRSPSTLDEVS